MRAIRKHPDDGSIPGVGLGVVLGPLGVDRGLGPDIQLEDLDIGFEEVGEFSSWGVERPGSWERDEGEVVGGYGIVERQGSGKSEHVDSTQGVTYRYLSLQLSPTRFWVSTTRASSPIDLSWAAVAKPL